MWKHTSPSNVRDWGHWRVPFSWKECWETVWKRRGLSFETILHVYHAMRLSYHPSSVDLSPGPFTPVTRKSFRHFTCIALGGKILHTKWQEHIPDTEVLQRIDSVCIGSMLMESQLWSFGHKAHLPDYRLPKLMFFGELCSGNRFRYKVTFKVALKHATLSLSPRKCMLRTGHHVGTLSCEVFSTMKENS